MHKLHAVKAGNATGEVLSHMELDFGNHGHLLEMAIKNFRTKERRKQAFFGRAIGPSMENCPIKLEQDEMFVADCGVPISDLRKGVAIVLEIKDQPGQYKLRCFKRYDANTEQIYTTTTENGVTRTSKSHDKNQYIGKVLVDTQTDSKLAA
jgi:hypothetical protein